ncbi:MAG: type VI secretion system tip protein VgrG, partial [Deltaproteobacteria bacterium]|nr:type VI secretion system tip protein VgrG [Deltaproteobacteria bacterium]
MGDNQLSTQFSLDFEAVPDFEVYVVKFHGAAALNSLYEFSVTALALSESFAKIDWNDLLASPVALTIENPAKSLASSQASDNTDGYGSSQGGFSRQDAWKATWHGHVTTLATGTQFGDYCFLEIGLGPSLGLLASQRQNRIHLDLNSLDVIKDSFQFGGLNSRHYKFLAKGDSYPKREFAFQHDETLLDFVQRTLQREGLTMFFDQTGPSEQIVISDSPQQHQAISDSGEDLFLTHSAVSSLGPMEDRALVFGFKAIKTIPPMSLLLKDYNWEDPNRPLAVSLKVSDHGRGEVHLYGENFTTEAEGQRLAKIRKEEYLSAAETFKGQSNVPGLMPGLAFSLTDHPLDSLNGQYLITATELGGSQSTSLSSRLGLDLGMPEQNFSHSFSCQKLSAPFRPARTIAPARIPGSLTAWVDGAGSGDKPEIDQYGRYKIILPLDVSGRDQGKASAWVRMAQPYVGRGYGQNFPLTPGAEVLLTFIDGNPDRPVITGAVANAENISLINSASNMKSGLGTKGGSSLMFHDEAGKQKVLLSSGSNRGSITLTADSPTNAVVQADQTNLINYALLSLSAGANKFTAGTEFSAIADTTKINKIFSGIQAAKALIAQAPEAASFNDPYSPGDNKPSEIVDKTSDFLEKLVLDTTATTINLVHILTGSKDLSLLPHKNKVTLGSTQTGGFHSLKSSEIDDKVTLINACSLLSTIAKDATATENAAKNLLDVSKDANDDSLKKTSEKIDELNSSISEAEKKLATYPKGSDGYYKQLAEVNDLKSQLSDKTKEYNDYLSYKTSDKTKAMKIMSASTAAGSEIAEVIASLFSKVATAKAMTSQ